MKTRSLILLASAITLAAGAALVGRALMRPPPPVTIVKQVEAPRAPVRQVLSVAGTLAPGEFVVGRSLVWRELPAGEIRAGYYAATTDEERRVAERAVAGSTPRRALQDGEPLTREGLVFNGDHGFVAAVLKPELRAVSIPTSAVTSNSGLVSAGDRVDVILHLERDETQPQTIGQPDASYTALASQTIVRNARVLGLNGNPSGIAPAASGPAEAGVADKKSAPPRNYYESITLEVSPKDAERLALSREVGLLQLALRSVQADSVAQVSDEDKSVTRVYDATDIFKKPARPPIIVQTFRGDRETAQVFRSPPQPNDEQSLASAAR
ncbi:Flp pilus assembly protein CpaB [Achromobacter seleniivolatilans]|uniref:Flp pilus assembly protein CpaB n=1 Tax=Achromobacter seleniivolatilans TaxID=3047478 RepID=A0ABY9LW28_9BURK|nr:Flp pilus assembly protein CpaB [Achromobacter sp. R39]WMD18996.1 Flp pilus assembly protein CpaB [Achromobacter sp. R39]